MENNVPENEVVQNPQPQNVPNEQPKKKSNCLQIMCCGCFSLILVVIVIVGVAVAIILSENRTWTENFEYEKKDFVSVDGSSYSEDLSNSLIEKTRNFSEYDQEVYYIELTPEEVATLIYEVVKESIPPQMELEEVVIDSRDQTWSLYLDMSYGGIDLPWFMADMSEDSEQSMNLAVERVRFGVIKLKRDGFLNILGKINDGYLDGVGIIDDSEVTGRDLINIELEKEALFIKGELRED